MGKWERFFLDAISFLIRFSILGVLRSSLLVVFLTWTMIWLVNCCCCLRLFMTTLLPTSAATSNPIYPGHRIRMGRPICLPVSMRFLSTLPSSHVGFANLSISVVCYLLDFSSLGWSGNHHNALTLDHWLVLLSLFCSRANPHRSISQWPVFLPILRTSTFS